MPDSEKPPVDFVFSDALFSFALLVIIKEPNAQITRWWKFQGSLIVSFAKHLYTLKKVFFQADLCKVDVRSQDELLF